MDDDLRTPKGLHARRDEVQILDVREQGEWDAGHIPGSLHVPLNQLLAGRTDDLSTEKPVVAICRSGNRSEVARMLLQAKGFDAYNLGGGVEDWSAEGLPFESADGSPGHVA